MNDTKRSDERDALFRVSARELAHILAGLRVLQTTRRHSADVDDITTDGGMHQPMGPGEIDDLCERLNLTPKTIGSVMDRLPSMVIQSDGDVWCALEGTELAFLPEGSEAYDAGVEASAIIAETFFSPATGVFDLARLIRELPLELLEAYRLEAGNKRGEGR